jgi:Na+-transporting methylmalonyl-CoA/oxaloacetate decarboxylase beta subunit
MFKYFILRKQQQLFCYFCGIVLAMVLMLLFPSVLRGVGFICFYRLLRCSGQALPFIPVTSTG